MSRHDGLDAVARGKRLASDATAMQAAYEVSTDVIQQQLVLIAVLAGMVSMDEALRATGLDPAEWDALVALAVATGRETVNVWLANGWVMAPAWSANVAAAVAAGMPVAVGRPGPAVPR